MIHPIPNRSSDGASPLTWSSRMQVRRLTTVTLYIATQSFDPVRLFVQWYVFKRSNRILWGLLCLEKFVLVQQSNQISPHTHTCRPRRKIIITETVRRGTTFRRSRCVSTWNKGKLKWIFSFFSKRDSISRRTNANVMTMSRAHIPCLPFSLISSSICLRSSRRKDSWTEKKNHLISRHSRRHRLPCVRKRPWQNSSLESVLFDLSMINIGSASACFIV